jgi:hypothetical protein
LLNSLSITGKSKVNLHWKEYMLGRDKEKPSGLAFLKVLIRESYLDSNATTGMIRTKLSNLDTYMLQVGNDITKFNSYVRLMVEALAARGEKSTDLLTYLFKGYAACSDKAFVKYISDKQNDWEEGSEIAPDQLMDYALTKFKILKTKEVWEAPSEEEEKLIALEARFMELKKKFKRKGKGDPEDGKGGFDRNKKLKGNPGGAGKPEWLKSNKAPSESELTKPRDWKKSQYHWCSTATGGKCGGKWRVHKPSECKGAARDINKDKGKDGRKKKVMINEALTQFQEADGGYHST